MQACTSLQTDNHASTPPLSFFYRPDALPAAQPTASKHYWRHELIIYIFVVCTALRWACLAGRDGGRFNFVQENRRQHHRVYTAADRQSTLPTRRRRQRLSDPEKNTGNLTSHQIYSLTYLPTCLLIGPGADQGSVTRVTSHSPPLAQQPISCYYYALKHF